MDDPATDSIGMPSDDLRAAAAWLDAQSARIRTMLIQWCEQPSWSYDLPGLNRMAELLTGDFSPLGMEHERIPLPPLRRAAANGDVEQPTGPGLIWHHRRSAARRVLMLIHYDTVYPPDAFVTETARARPTVQMSGIPVMEGGRGQRLIGPGVADAKGGIAVIRFACEALLRFELSGELGWSIALNPDEELGSPSSEFWLAGLAPLFEVGFVFEPSLPDGAMVANRKGTGNWRYVIGGRAAHAGRNPEQGRNAVLHAAKLALELERLNDPESGLTVNVGRLNGGEALNQVPDRAVVELNVRVVDNRQAESIEAELAALQAKYDCPQEGYRCALSGRFHSPPKRLDDRYRDLHDLYSRAAKQVGRQIHWRDTGGACDGSKLAAAGLVNIDTMGPIGGDLHSATEYCDFDSLIGAAKTLVYLMAMKAACGS